MPGTKPDVGSLALRKQLLLAESEVNRALMGQELSLLADESREIVHRLKSVCDTVGSFASAGLAGLNAFKEMRTERANGRPSWLATMINGIRIGSALWKTFRSR